MLTNRSIFIGALLWIVPLAVSGQDTPSIPLKVLFIGNSYTSVNDLPAMVAGLADARATSAVTHLRHLEILTYRCETSYAHAIWAWHQARSLVAG
jgi:hypothetical protein